MSFDLGSFAGSAASSLIGGAASVIGAGLSYHKQKKLAEQQYKYQKEFAQNGIQWKTQDAIAAGLHPLYALGASSASYSPSGITDGGIGDAVSQFGQNIGRAVEAGMTYDEKKAKQEADEAIQQATLERLKAETAESQMRTKEAQSRINRSYIGDQLSVMQFLNSDRRVSTSHNPPQPSTKRHTQVSYNASKAGSPSPGRISQATSDSKNTGFASGSIPQYTFAETPDGALDPVMSPDLSESTEDDLVAKVGFQINKHFFGRFGNEFPTYLNRDVPKWAPKGTVWKWNRWRAKYMIYDPLRGQYIDRFGRRSVLW